MKAKKTRRGVPVHYENPFLMELKTRTRRVINRRGDMMLINSETGEIQSNIAGFWESEEVDATKFIKLFIRGVKALKELTSAGTKVFEVLYLQVQQNAGRDKVFMSFSEVDQALTPMSESTYTRGMRELIEKGFIAATPTQGWFWINPSYIWNGDRLAFVKEYRRRSRIGRVNPPPAFGDPLEGVDTASGGKGGAKASAEPVAEALPVESA